MSERIGAIDAVKAISVFFMVGVHCLWMYGDPHVQESSVFGYCIQILGRGASMFLVGMGASFVLAAPKTGVEQLRRSSNLFYRGYRLNVLKFLVPLAFGVLPTSFIAAYGWKEPLLFSQALYLLGTGDILQLAAIAVLGMTMVHRWLPRRSLVAILIAIGVAMSTHVVRGYRPGVIGLDYICDVLWGTHWNVYFPAFPWLTSVFMGMALGYEVKQDRSRLVPFTLLVGFGAIGLGSGLVWYDSDTHFGDFFHMGFGGAIASSGWGLLSVSLGQLLIRLMSSSVLAITRWLSRRVTELYVTQWVLVCWGMSWFGYHTLSEIEVIGTWALIGALTVGVQLLVEEMRRFTSDVRATTSSRLVANTSRSH